MRTVKQLKRLEFFHLESLAQVRAELPKAAARESRAKFESMVEALRIECGNVESPSSLYWVAVKSTELRRRNRTLCRLVECLSKQQGTPERRDAEDVLRLCNVGYYDGPNNSRTFTIKRDV